MHTVRPLRRHFVSAVALGLVLGILATPFGIAHVDAVSDVCAPDRQPDASGSSRVGADVLQHLHQHCFTCHWLQSFRSTLLVSGAVVLDVRAAHALPSETPLLRECQPGTTVPARAPPIRHA